MSEQHVFLYDTLPVEHGQMRGGKGEVAICRMLTADALPPGSPFKMTSVNVIPPGASIGPHIHEGEAEIYLIISGSGIYSGKDGKSVRVKTGDLTICYSGESHGIENDTQEPLRMAGIIAAK
ncbi:MAG: cupin domain-containing protein [Deltaproteobacteria bacterium]|jgi:mannose-6-phosphate isomerase-like protein (cupin superfamily)|nr:cupin domain-containing protein [Deltaproteobacteria bacterium]